MECASDSVPSEARKRGSGGGSPRKYDDLLTGPPPPPGLASLGPSYHIPLLSLSTFAKTSFNHTKSGEATEPIKGMSQLKDKCIFSTYRVNHSKMPCQDLQPMIIV
jgi:hypothetical protein